VRSVFERTINEEAVAEDDDDNACASESEEEGVTNEVDDADEPESLDFAAAEHHWPIQHLEKEVTRITTSRNVHTRH
jgi:hypothetical protein